MKNNKLHIHYTNNGSVNINIPEDTIESLRCKHIDRAQEIVGMRNPEIVKKAIFKDSFGTEYIIK